MVQARKPKRQNRTQQSSCYNEDGGKRHGGNPRLRWKDTVGRDMKAWNTREEWATDTGTGIYGKVSARSATTHPACADVAGRKVRKV